MNARPSARLTSRTLRAIPLEKKQYPFGRMFAAVGLVAAVGLADYAFGTRGILVSFLYLGPVALTAWFVGRRTALGVGALCAITFVVVDYQLFRIEGNLFVYGFNFLSRLVPLFLVSELLAQVRKMLDRARELAQTDSLTGALNRRAFMERADVELRRLKRNRRPLTLAYLDVDDFKAVNDRYGHARGDRLLALLANTMRDSLRDSDGVGRMGGDEFVILLPECGPDAARQTVEKLITRVSGVLQEGGWAVTVSVGAVTCHQAPAAPDGIIELADQLMYTVKASSKNGMKFAELPLS